MRVLGYGNVRGVDMEKFSRRQEVMNLARELRNDGIFTFLFVGRIARDKGVDELVAAFTRLTEQYDNVRLILVGWNEHNIDPVKEETLSHIKNSPNIDFVGSIYGDDLLAYYAASDCFVFPSYREGFPNTVMEAGAMDLPCIVTDINGSREIIVDGKNGVIIPSKDVDALYHAMKEMVENQEKRNLYASNARQMIAERFEQGFVRKCLYKFYEEIG